MTEVELAVGGMTCASCSSRIEKKLNRMEGVTATVNLATEKAKVSFGETEAGAAVAVAQLIALVEKLGYTAEEIVPPPPEPLE
ncbi:cation transporter, partial [Streptomyces atriruber]|uniref:cation transporter n=1 Tax=Streptomyces atriruber TaxID=545121 RepID=UPI000A42C2AC